MIRQAILTMDLTGPIAFFEKTRAFKKRIQQIRRGFLTYEPWLTQSQATQVRDSGLEDGDRGSEFIPPS